MITPTKTVCYIANGLTEGSRITGVDTNKQIVESVFDDRSELWGTLLENVKRVRVREEAIEQKPQYLWCNKNLSPMNPCNCGDCEMVLKFFSNIKSLPL